jgi:hypothetical protein
MNLATLTSFKEAIEEASSKLLTFGTLYYFRITTTNLSQLKQELFQHITFSGLNALEVVLLLVFGTFPFSVNSMVEKFLTVRLHFLHHQLQTSLACTQYSLLSTQ